MHPEKRKAIAEREAELEIIKQQKITERRNQLHAIGYTNEDVDIHKIEITVLDEIEWGRFIKSITDEVNEIKARNRSGK